MKSALLALVFAVVSLTNCVHVSSKSLTAFGTDAENISYTSSNGQVAFHADKMNNSVALGKVTDLGGKIINWWGTAKVVDSASKAFASVKNTAAVQKTSQLKNASDAQTAQLGITTEAASKTEALKTAKEAGATFAPVQVTQ